MKQYSMVILAVALSISPAASAADFSDPTWPCVQRKVPQLSIAQMWAGPLPPEDAALDEDAERLAAALSVRRTGLEEAEALVSDYAAGLEEARNARLAALFGAVFERIGRERSVVIAGIGRYAQKQTALSERIDANSQERAALEAKDDKSNADWDRLEALHEIIEWDTRIFRERAQSLTYVCETPVLLEKRAFALARIVMNALE